jgi:hypothetical protein
MLPTLLSLIAISSAPTINPRLIDVCGSGSADASVTLGADVDSRELASNGTAYANKNGCKRFVADFTVPSNANPAATHGITTFDLGGMFAAQPGTPSTCNATELMVSTYEKVAGSNSFVKRTNAKYQGQWSEGMFSSCFFVKVWGADPPSDTPNAAGTEVWRVAVSATHNGNPMAAKARIAFQIVPW